MRVVHVVERDATPGRLVVATADGLEQFELEIDQTLRNAVRSARPPVPASTPAAASPTGNEPKMSPREIQVRVRAGETPQAIAETSGAGLDWVLRFAQPVLAERARIADEARRAKARRSTTEGQTVIFGEAVDERFAAHGIDPATVTWDAHRREDAQWVITARWIGGQSEHEALWVCHLGARTVTPLDDTAADLLSDRPIRPVEPEPAEPATPSLTLAPPLAPGLVAFPAMPDAHTGPLPRGEEVFDQSRFDVDEPPLPLHVPGHPSAKPTRRNLGVANKSESDDEKAARASIPSWDDILLGVRRKND